MPVAARASAAGFRVTRYREDPTRDPGGQFLYLRDVRSGSVWSATHQPLDKEPEEYFVTFLPEKATFHRRDDDIATQLDIAVSTEDDVEVRRLAITNKSDRPREIEITSYAEIVLAPADDDLAHPAFGKLFVETEYLPECAALLCRRRPRSSEESELWAVHVLSLEGRTQGELEWESDRHHFLGRGRGPDRPRALDGRSLSGTTGALVDPIVSLRQRIRLGPGGFVRLAFATGMASTRETAVALAEKYRDPGAAARTFALAFAHAQSGLNHLGISSEEARLFERLASRVLYADGSLRASPDLLAQNELGQEDLWPHAISGDLPILLVRVAEADGVPLVRQVLQAQEYWRLKGLSADIVILNEHPTSYLDEMQEHLEALLDNGPWREWKHRPGGAYLLRGDAMTERERILLASVARAVVSAEQGTLAHQLDGLPLEQPEPEELAPSVDERAELASSSTEVEMPRLELANGVGGFSDEGRTYAIVLEGDEETPWPWVNVIANPTFGTVVTASGAAHTWSVNSRENRLTPFECDPVTDATTEALFVRDEETGETWSPTPGPMLRTRSSGRFVIRHAAGLTRFDRFTQGIRHELEIFVDVNDPIKFSLLSLTNESGAHRRLSVFAYNEWALGPPRAGQNTHVVTELDRQERSGLGQKPLPPRATRARRVHPCERARALGDRRSEIFSGQKRHARPGGSASPLDPVRPFRSGARSLCGPSGFDHVGAGGKPFDRVPPRARRGPRRGTRARRASRERPRGGRGARKGTRFVGRHPRRNSRPNAGRFFRFAHEPLAFVSGRELSTVGALGLFPAERCLRISRPAPGRHGALVHAAGSRERASATRSEPAISGRGRATLVARTEWPRHAHPLLGRSVVASPCRRPLCSDDGRPSGAGRARALPGGAPACSGRAGGLPETTGLGGRGVAV